jgi:DNA-binding MarR family transcriptional regulator
LRKRLFDDFGETLSRLDCLAALSRAPEGVTMTELSRLLRLTKGNITGLIARLIRDGLVNKRSKDGRSTTVVLSLKGQRLFSSMATSIERDVDLLLSSLNVSEANSLSDILTKLRKDL